MSTIQELCKQIEKIYASKVKADGYKIKQLIYQFTEAFKVEKVNENNLQLILDLALIIANSKNPMKQSTEKALLSYLTYFPIILFEDGAIKKLPSIEQAEKIEIIVWQLINFAKELLKVKIPRESFSGKRKGYAIDLIGTLALYYDFPAFLEICKEALKQKSENQFADTLETLMVYYENRGGQPDEEIIQLVEKRIKKAKKRSEASNCLRFLVGTGVIMEMTAFDEIEKWEAKNYIQ